MLPELQAERQLAAIEAAIMPDLKPNDRSAVFRRLQGHLRGAVRGSSAAEALAKAGIPTVLVPKGGEIDGG